VWHDLSGYVAAYLAPTAGSGTVTVPSGGSIVLIVAHASAGGAYLTIFGGPEIVVVSGAPPLVIPFNHDLWTANSSNSGAVVFSGTDSAMVHYVKAGNT
jgi:hypothetical protein